MCWWATSGGKVSARNNDIADDGAGKFVSVASRYRFAGYMFLVYRALPREPCVSDVRELHRGETFRPRCGVSLRDRRSFGCSVVDAAINISL